MKEYTFEVSEKLTCLLHCTVYANTLDEAKEKAECGETENEWNHCRSEIIDRMVLWLIKEEEVPELEEGKQ